MQIFDDFLVDPDTVRQSALAPMLHKHHIVPRHMGGSDDPSNLIELTVAEHAEAHLLLWGKYGREHDRLAWLGLSGQIGKEELIRLARIAGNNGKKRSAETKAKQSAASKGRPKSAAHRAAMSVSRMGNKRGVGNKNSLGKKHTEEWKAARSKAATAWWAAKKTNKAESASDIR